MPRQVVDAFEEVFTHFLASRLVGEHSVENNRLGALTHDEGANVEAATLERLFLSYYESDKSVDSPKLKCADISYRAKSAAKLRPILKKTSGLSVASGRAESQQGSQ